MAVDCFFFPWQAEGWGGWALPFNRDDGGLLHMSLYGKDCLQFVKSFLRMSGLGTVRSEPRSLVNLQGDDEQAMPLEARNKMLLKSSFFHKSFEPSHASMQKAGLLFAANSDNTLRNEELVLLSVLEPGYGQLVDGASMTNQSIWVTSSGFFYVLRFLPIQTANRKFTTPLFTLKAWTAPSIFYFVFSSIRLTLEVK